MMMFSLHGLVHIELDKDQKLKLRNQDLKRSCNIIGLKFVYFFNLALKSPVSIFINGLIF